MDATFKTPAESPATPAYLPAKDCAARYAVSVRHWWRLSDAGRVPRPTRLGSSVRWSVAALLDWERDGCRDCRQAKGGRQ